MTQDKKYYLTNNTDKTISIKLSTNRTIKPHKSLPLNCKDVEIVRELKSKFRGKRALINELVFTAIPLKENRQEPEKAEEEKRKAKAKAEKELSENDKIKLELEANMNKGNK